MRTFRDIQPEGAAHTESASVNMFAQYLRKMQFRMKIKISGLGILNVRWWQE